METDPNPEPEIQIELAPDAVVEPKPESDPIPEPAPLDEDNYLKIDRKNFAQEITRLQREDPEFANVFNSMVGNKAKRTYQPQLDELNADRVALRQELRRREILAMEDKEIEDKFSSDPAFAKEYAEVVHRSPEATRADIDNRRVLSAINDVVSDALDNGLPEEKAAEFLKAVGEGRYDRDADGRAISTMQGILLMQRDINSAVLALHTNGSPAPKEAPPKANPELAKPGPDTSSVGVRNSRRDTSLEDYRQALKEGKELPSDEIDRLTAKFVNR